MLTPYRTSLRERPEREIVPRAAIVSLQLVGALFVIATVGCAAAMSFFGALDAVTAFNIGGALSTGVSALLPLLLLGMAVRAMPPSRSRLAVVVSSFLWIASIVAQRFAVTMGASVALGVVALGGVAHVPFLVARRRVIARWPLFAVLGILTGDLARTSPVLSPSWTTMVLVALLAYTYLAAARELRDESFDARAARFPPAPRTLFATEQDRAAFLGPVRLATDATIALAVLTTVESTSDLAYGGALRLDAPPTSLAIGGLLVVLVGALIWLKRMSAQTSLAPTAGALAATAAAFYSAKCQHAPTGNMMLLLLSTAVIGLAVVAPPTVDPDGRTSRQWVVFTKASGVLLGSAGFFALTASSHGEASLSRAAKLAAAVFGILAANAASKLELHARVELVAEDREP